MTRIDGALALVTGGASGIGREVADQLLRRGARVVLVDYNEATGRNAERELRATYGRAACVFAQADVSDTSALETAFVAGKRSLGRAGERYTIVVNNAGVIEDPKHLWDPSPRGVRGWKRVLDIDLTAVVDGTRLAVADMERAPEGGVVINVGSMAGLLPVSHGPVYGAAKAAVVHFSRSLLPRNRAVRVNVICPSYTETPMVVDALPSDDTFRTSVESLGLMSTGLVAEGVLQLIEDDTKRGAVMRVTKANGIDYQKYRLTAEQLVFMDKANAARRKKKQAAGAAPRPRL
jgi:15-hydroxyprostaglandin dehydrogenase (NAD)